MAVGANDLSPTWRTIQQQTYDHDDHIATDLSMIIQQQTYDHDDHTVTDLSMIMMTIQQQTYL